MSQRKDIWLDCDPGHDDACAIILAGHCPTLNLLGISTVMGNQTIEKTTHNALTITQFCGLECVDVCRGQACPLVEPLSICPEIHGDSGLDSTFQLPPVTKTLTSIRAIPYMFEKIFSNPRKVTLVCTGCLTNAALLIRLYPEVIEKIEELVLLGGAVGVGNIGPVAEWNIMVDPEAAHIIFESGIRIVQIPIDVSHTVLVTKPIMDSISALSTPFSTFLVALMSFFAKTYKEVFDFDDPPLHDPLAVAYVISPELFTTRFVRVDIETKSVLSRGQTVCDVNRMTKRPPNVHLATKVDIEGFWALMLAAFKKSNSVSSLNEST